MQEQAGSVVSQPTSPVLPSAFPCEAEMRPLLLCSERRHGSHPSTCLLAAQQEVAQTRGFVFHGVLWRRPPSSSGMAGEWVGLPFSWRACWLRGGGGLGPGLCASHFVLPQRAQVL